MCVCGRDEEKTQHLWKTSEREMRYRGEERDGNEHKSKGGGEPSDSEGQRLITHCGERWRRESQRSSRGEVRLHGCTVGL